MKKQCLLNSGNYVFMLRPVCAKAGVGHSGNDPSGYLPIYIHMRTLQPRSKILGIYARVFNLIIIVLRTFSLIARHISSPFPNPIGDINKSSK